MLVMGWKAKIKVPAKPAPKLRVSALKDDETQAQFDAVMERVLLEERAAVKPPQLSDLDWRYQTMRVASRKAMEEVLPSEEPLRGRDRARSERTQGLIDERVRLLTGIKRGTAKFKQVQRAMSKRIADSKLKDWEEYVEGLARDMQKAADKRDAKAVSKLVKQVVAAGGGARHRKNSKQPSVDENGRAFGCAQELADAWGSFCAGKFTATSREVDRAWPDLGPAELRQCDVPLDADLEKCLAALRDCKAVGEDGIPTELYKESSVARKELFVLTKQCWREEDVPADMVLGLFVTVYKNKGSCQDMTKYRCICLLNHAYKLLSSYLLLRILREIEGFLEETQAGFRKERGTRDNVVALAALIDEVVSKGESCVITFIDFVAAFDSVSHRFLDEAIRVALESGASNRNAAAGERASEVEPVSWKCRAMFRAVYNKASARVRVRESSGEHVCSKAFPVHRGVVQGDIFSPVCFIVALTVILTRSGLLDDIA